MCAFTRRCVHRVRSESYAQLGVCVHFMQKALPLTYFAHHAGRTQVLVLKGAACNGAYEIREADEMARELEERKVERN